MLPVLLLSDVTVSEAAEFSVSQQADVLLIFGAKDCSANWIANNSIQVKFCFISLSPLKHYAEKTWLLALRDEVIIASEEIKPVGTT